MPDKKPLFFVNRGAKHLDFKTLHNVMEFGG